VDVSKGVWIDPRYNAAYSELSIDQGGLVQPGTGIKE
jgi:hypothetical protein